MRRLSRTVWFYIAVVTLAACVLIARGPFTGIGWFRLAVLALLFLVCDSTPTPLMPRRVAWSPSTSATLASVVILGPVGAAIVGAVSVLSVRRGLLVAQRAFNGGMYALSAYAAGWTFMTLHGGVGIPDSKSFPGIIGPFAVAAAVGVISNHVLVAGVLWLTRNSEGATQKKRITLGIPLMLSDLGYAAFGLLIAALWSVVGAFAAILVLIPLFVARWAIGQYAEQQRAYEATMAALCKAVETKDFYTRGHS
ncbi:MAG: metal-dependent phosphohydrolase, partial [Streptosporangiaceae bacterium]